MQYAIGFDERSDVLLKTCDTGKPKAILNLSPLLKLDETQAHDTVSREIAGIAESLADGDAVITSNAILDANIRAALGRGFQFSYLMYERISSFVAIWLRNSSALNKARRRDHITLAEAQDCADGPTPACAIDDWGDGVYGRYGNVELSVLESWIRDSQELYAQQREIISNLEDEEYMYASAQRSYFLSASDVNFNLRRLMTNAGFYAPLQQEDESLQVWCDLYYRAIKNSRMLFPYMAVLPNFLVVQDKILAEGGEISYAGFPSHAAFYALLEGKDVLLVTPFASQINQLYADGRMFDLYADVKVPRFKLRAVPSYISTYPNRPHGSWLETFGALCAAIDQEFQNRPFTIFFASAGCYGMPLADYVHERYGGPAVYNGNWINALFGIRQACTENAFASSRKLHNWAKSDLASVPNVARIDGGRYTM